MFCFERRLPFPGFRAAGLELTGSRVSWFSLFFFLGLKVKGFRAYAAQTLHAKTACLGN